MTEHGSESRAGRARLKPAEMEEGGERKLAIAVVLFCVSEVWAITWGSGVLHAVGLIRSLPIMIAVGSAGMLPALIMGLSIETWLAIISGEPLLNENDEIDSVAPMERGLAYLIPPFVAVFGAGGIAAEAWAVPVATAIISLLTFVWLIARIRRVWRAHRTL